MTGWLLLLSLLVLGGVLSTLGDRLGSRVGKARLSLFGLRPRQTAVVITVLTGSLISALSLGLMLLVSRQLRVGLFELNDLEARLRSSRSDLKGSRSAQRKARQQLKEARADEIKARKILANAQARAGELRSTLQPLQEQTRRLEAERQRLSQDVRNRDAEIQRTDDELRAVRERISSGEAELEQLEENLLALRRGDVAISSGQPLATVTLKLDRPDQARQVIDEVLREANLQAFQKVLPGQTPDRQIILVSRQDIEGWNKPYENLAPGWCCCVQRPMFCVVSAWFLPSRMCVPMWPSPWREKFWPKPLLPARKPIQKPYETASTCCWRPPCRRSADGDLSAKAFNSMQTPSIHSPGS